MQSTVERTGGYTGSRSSPIGIGGAIAVHALVVGAILLIPKDIIDVIPPPTLWATNVPIITPPPEPEIQKPVERRPLPPTNIDKPSVLDTPELKLPTTGDEPIGGDVPFSGEGTGSTGDTVVDPPRAPVMADAIPDPRYRRDFQPAYPPAMQRLQEEGKVTVRIRIGADGRVIAVEKIFATSEAFWEATRAQALRKWRFRPATRDGVSIEGERVMTVHFRMEE